MVVIQFWIEIKSSQTAKPLILSTKYAASDGGIAIRAEKGKGILDERSPIPKGVVAVMCKWKRPGWWVLGVMIGTMPGIE